MPRTFQPARWPKRRVRSGRLQRPQEGGQAAAPPRRGPGWRTLALLCLTLVTAFVVYIDVRVRPALVAASQSVARRAATDALNDALQTAVARAPDDGQILHVEVDANGNLRLASFDFRTVSQVEDAAASQAEAELDRLSESRIPLPVSQSVGGALLSVWSPNLPVRIHLVGSAHVSVRMSADTVGINQSVHALFLDLTAEVQPVAPLVGPAVEVRSSVPLAYVVLNGSVPDTWVGNGRPGNRSGTLVLPPAP
ncbi:MAG: sporulation protein YunB [Alicyclobacillus sp.]|nr:sporulation protein YunB [Alicyclobacillus sp.]